MKRNILMLLAMLSVAPLVTASAADPSVGTPPVVSSPATPEQGWFGGTWNGVKARGTATKNWFTAEDVKDDADGAASFYGKHKQKITRAQRSGGLVGRGAAMTGAAYGGIKGMEALAKSQIWSDLTTKYPLLGRMFNPNSRIAKGISAAVLALLADALVATSFGVNDNDALSSIGGAAGRGIYAGGKAGVDKVGGLFNTTA